MRKTPVSEQSAGLPWWRNDERESCCTSMSNKSPGRWTSSPSALGTVSAFTSSSIILRIGLVAGCPSTTDTFPTFRLDDIITEAKAAIGGHHVFPQEIGGAAVKLLIGIRSTQLAPVLKFTLPSGLCVYECKFRDVYGATICFGSPHKVFTRGYKQARFRLTTGLVGTSQRFSPSFLPHHLHLLLLPCLLPLQLLLLLLLLTLSPSLSQHLPYTRFSKASDPPGRSPYGPGMPSSLPVRPAHPACPFGQSNGHPTGIFQGPLINIRELVGLMQKVCLPSANP